MEIDHNNHQEHNDHQDNDDDSSHDQDDDNQNAFLQRILRSILYDRPVSHSNEILVQNLKRQRIIETPFIEQALLMIPREYFVTEDLKGEAYYDNPLRLAKMGFNISAPHMYGMCLEKLDIQPGNIVLDIGSGTGHFTVLSAYLAGPEGFAYGLDLHDYIIDFSKNNLKNYSEKTGLNIKNVKFEKRNCFLPDVDGLKYDRIHVGACCPESYLDFLINLLKPCGILVTPYGDKLIKVSKNDKDEIRQETLVGVRYSDLILPSDAEIKEAEKMVATARARRISVPESNILKDIGNLLNNSLLSDVILVVEGREIFAHKMILQIRSNQFKGMLSSGLRESRSNKIYIDDFTYDLFFEILKFIYTDICDITEENCLQLLQASNYYQLDRLKALCELFCYKDMDSDNVSQFLNFADRYEANQLKSYALEFIYSHIGEVVKSETWKELDPDMITQILIKSVEKSK